MISQGADYMLSRNSEMYKVTHPPEVPEGDSLELGAPLFIGDQDNRHNSHEHGHKLRLAWPLLFQ